MAVLNYVIFLVIFLTAVTAAQLTIYILNNRKRIYLKGLLGLSVCVFIYSLFYSFELISRNLYCLKLFTVMEHIGTIFISVFWVIMALEYTNKGRYLNTRLYLTLTCLPILFIIMNLTDGYHHLFYRNYSVTIMNSLTIVRITPGVGYIAALIYINLMYLFGNVLHIEYFIKNKIYKKRSFAIMLTCLLPWAGSWMYILNLFPIKIDFTPILMAIVCIIYYKAISKNSIFQTAAIARHVIFDNINDIILVLDMDNKIIDANKKAEQLFNKKTANIVGQDLTMAIKSLKEISKYLKSKNEEKFDLIVKYNNGEYYFTGEITFINSDGKVIILKDSTEQNLMIKKLKYYATMDILTEVYNRNYFYIAASHRIMHCINNNRTVSLIMMDIDKFKYINDTYGHSAGDHVLKNVAAILKKCLEENCVIGRYGGEEFIIVIEDLEEEKVIETVEKLRLEITNFDNVYEDKIIKVTSSFGIFTTYNLTDLDEMIKFADEALYKSKDNGRNRVSIHKECEVLKMK